MSSVFIVLLLLGGLAYALGSARASAAVRRGDPGPLNQARTGAAAGAALMLAALVVHGADLGEFPIRGAMTAFAFLSLLVSLVALALDGLRKLPIFLVAILPLATVTCALALALALAPPSEEVPAAASVWTSLHISVAIASYGAFSLSFVSGILYLVAQHQLKERQLSLFLGFMPPLETVRKLNVRSMAAGVLLLMAGILVGYLQARRVYELDFDRLDPKIILSSLTFLAYVAVLVLSVRPAFKGRRTAMASIAGFLLVMINFWASVFWSGFHQFR